MDPTSEVTRLLGEIGRGQKDAVNQLLPLVYDELHRLARSYFRRERGDHTLQPTALVHEAYLRLVDQRAVMENRGHFLAEGTLGELCEKHAERDLEELFFRLIQRHDEIHQLETSRPLA